MYGSKVWHSTDKYRKVIWQCNDKYKGKSRCATPRLTDDEIKHAFLRVVNQLAPEREEIVANLRLLREQSFDTVKLESESNRLLDEVNDAYDLVQSDIAANARMARDQAEYRKSHDELVSKYEEACDRYQKAKEKLMQMEAKKRELDNFIKSVADLPEVVTDFDNSLWGAIVDHVTVYRHGEICFTLRDGSEVKA